VSVLLNHMFKGSRVDSLSLVEHYLETVFVDFIFNNKKILVGTVYRPPSGDKSLFLSKMEDITATIAGRKYDHSFICGDFNIDLLDLDGNIDSTNYLNLLASHSHLPLITKPTRVVGDSASLIDNIFSKDLNNFTSAIIISDISDHYPICVVYDNFFSPTVPGNCYRLISYRQFNDGNISSLYHAVEGFDFSNVLSSNCVDGGFELFNAELFALYDRCIPVKVKSVSYKDDIKPWIDRDTKIKIRRRQNYYVLFKMGRMTRQAYCRYRNMVTSEIRNKRKLYYSSKFLNLKNNLRGTWRLINEVIKPNVDKNTNNFKLFHDGSTVTNSQEVATVFNNYFSTIGSSIADLSGRADANYRQYLSGDFVNSFYFSPVSEISVCKIISSLKNKSCHLNEIPISILMKLSKLISPILSALINFSFVSGKFPKLLKTARVVPVFKGGDSASVNNYRPISILSSISKIYERVVHSQLLNYFNSHHILYGHQYGFRPCKSTSQAVLNLLNKIYAALDNDNMYFTMFLDLRKAFDCVSHDILLGKLYSYGIRGIPHEWFKSYLSEREQYVSIDNINSSCTNVNCGVPQGSILGPLLFLVFVNDFPNCSNRFEYFLFADDTSLSLPFPRKRLNSIHTDINEYLCDVSDWLNNNKLMLNVDKTKYMIFTYRNSFSLQSVKFNGADIECVRSMRYLGLIFDNNLNFDAHIDMVASKMSRNVGIICKICHFFPRSALVSIYYAIVHPYLTYCIEAWFGAPKYLRDKLFVLQKRCVRLIGGVGYLDDVDVIFKTLGILKLEDIYYRSVGVYMFKSINVNNFDDDLLSYVNGHTDQHEYATRNSSQVTLPFFRRLSRSLLFTLLGVEFGTLLTLRLRIPCR